MRAPNSPDFYECRKCRKCGKVQTLDRFYITRRKDGRYSFDCKACRIAYVSRNYHETVAEGGAAEDHMHAVNRKNARAYYQRHKDVILARQKAKRVADNQEVNRKQRERRAKLKARLRAIPDIR